ncbi:HesA/MoeB/ThiF family protein [Symmachiella dynata]|uniref:HesA/MoeB/ThiF family protein n=1 Tax=Symmachiella dynata TaxID=2527995 RepID=UPI0030EE2FA2
MEKNTFETYIPQPPALPGGRAAQQKHSPPPSIMIKSQPLTDEERATYQWQMWTPGFGEAGQEKLRGASVLVSRVGGLGSVVAYELAAAGIGKLVLAHAGNVKHSDLNRQLLMTHDWLGKPRVESATQRLLELNPRLEIEPIGENISEENAERIVAQADVIVDCAPLFEERFAMNRQALAQNKPLIECAMYELEGQITTIIPGKTPCLRCLHPEPPPAWKREFPVFGAVSGTVGCLGAMEAIKVISGLGEPLAGRMVTYDLRDMTFRRRNLLRNPTCADCGNIE